jgi:septum formation protein
VDGAAVTSPNFNASGATLWRCAQPLILASKSFGRRLVLQQTGLPFVSMPAAVDERALEQEVRAKGGGADDVSLALARAKALHISAQHPDSFVLGADQVASCDGRLFGKPKDMTAAAEQLLQLSGHVHRLHSAVVLARGGVIKFETVSHADLSMRPLNEDFLKIYLGAVGEAALGSAGAYQIEGLGVHLFSEIKGDHWTILGLPLLPVLEALRRESALTG